MGHPVCVRTKKQIKNVPSGDHDTFSKLNRLPNETKYVQGENFLLSQQNCKMI